MSDLIISYFVESMRSTPYGQRIWSDGRVENFFAKRTPPGEASHGPDWHPVTQLSEVQVQAMQQSIAAADLNSLLDVKMDSDQTATGESAEWQILLDDELETIKLPIWSPGTPQQRPLMVLLERMGEIVIAAQSGKQTAP